MIIVPTIPCTGTHFLLDMLGVKPRGMLWTEQLPEKDVRYGHIYYSHRGAFLPLIKKNWHGNVVIIPLRHPHVVAESWRQRGMNLFELIEMFEMLVDNIDTYHPLYLPLDADALASQSNQSTRRLALDNINYVTGLNLKTDWDPVESKNGNAHLDYRNIDPDPLIVDLVDRISGFLSRFY